MLTQQTQFFDMNRNIVFDRESLRKIDDNGYMHVMQSHITKETVSPYYGSEIPGGRKAGLRADKIYYGLRDGTELEKSLALWERMPLYLDHHNVSSDKPHKRELAGSIGSNISWAKPYLDADLVIIDKEVQKKVEDGTFKEISAAYSFIPEFVSGEYNGQKYDFIMRDIKPNHVALVVEGRNGPDVSVSDSMPSNIKTEENGMKEKKGFLASLVKRKVVKDSPESLEGAETAWSRFPVALNAIEAINEGTYEPSEVEIDGIDEITPEMLQDEEVIKKIISATVPNVGEDDMPHMVAILKEKASQPIDPSEDVIGEDEETISAEKADLTVEVNVNEEGDVGSLEVEGVQVDISDEQKERLTMILEEKGIIATDDTMKAYAEGAKDMSAEMTEDEEWPDDRKSFSVVDKNGVKDSKKRKNMDIKKIIHDAVMQERRSRRVIADTALMLEPYIGKVDRDMFDTVSGLRKHALEVLGIPTKAIPASHYESVLDSHIKKESDLIRSAVADSSVSSAPKKYTNPNFEFLGRKNKGKRV